MKTIIYLFVLLMIASTVIAASDTFDNIEFTRIAPDSAYLGEKVWVSIMVENTGSAEKQFTIKENLHNNVDFDKAESKVFTTEYGENINYYEWTVKLKPGESTVVSYWIIPKVVGSYDISASLVTLGGNTYYLSPYSIEMNCAADDKCDITVGENYLTCPADCRTGLADNICDSASDGTCDPDCEPSYDLDCKAGIGKPAAGSKYLLPAIIVIAVLAIILLIALFARKKR